MRTGAPPVSAIPLAVFRILFGTCLAVDIAWLLVDAPLWFRDALPIPIEPLLLAWMLVAGGVALGAFTRFCTLANWVACVGFLGFAARPAGFEYHVDSIWLLTSIGLPFLPVSNVLSVDAWRRDRALARRGIPPKPLREHAIGRAPEVFLALVVSSIYLDSAIWKLSSRLWVEGLGYWTPAVQPQDAWIALPFTLDHEWIARGSGYATLAFELAFPALVWFRRLRPPLLLFGAVLHLGIATVIPLPFFGAAMLALLAGLVPLRARGANANASLSPSLSPSPDPSGTREDGVEPGAACGARLAEPWRRSGMAAFYSVWGIVFALGLTEPVHALVKFGPGGIDGPVPLPWHTRNDSKVATAYRGTMEWAYRLFGGRTHPIFLDGQFNGYDTATRLVYREPRPDGLAPTGAEASEGRRFYGPNRNRRWLSWTYRVVRPRLPRGRVEVQLRRFVDHWAARRGLDLARGEIVIEQRPMDLPVDAWRPGVRAANVAAPWRPVGRMTRSGPGEALEFLWGDPCWR